MSVRERTWEWKGTKKSAWIVDYFDEEGSRRMKTFKSRKDADKFADAIERPRFRKEALANAAAALKDFLRDWRDVYDLSNSDARRIITMEMTDAFQPSASYGNGLTSRSPSASPSPPSPGTSER